MGWIQEVGGRRGKELRMVPRFYVPVVLKCLGNGSNKVKKNLNSLILGMRVNNVKRLKNTALMMQRGEGLSAERSRSRGGARKEDRRNDQLDMKCPENI